MLVRDIGKLFLDCLEEGVKFKFYFILEKFIKESFLVKVYLEVVNVFKLGVELEVFLIIEGVSLNDLKGFVGYWDKDFGKFLGVWVDKWDVCIWEVESVGSIFEFFEYEKSI